MTTVAGNFHKIITSSEVRHAHQLAYAVRMIGDIAANYDVAVDNSQFLCARAMLDAFYVNARLLGDFLIKPTNGMDFGPADFGVPEWEPPSSSAAQRLQERWQEASTYVVHFGRPRVPHDLDDLQQFQVSGRAFREITSDALRVFAVFLYEVEANTPPWSDDALVPDPERDPSGFRARTLHDRTEILVDAFTDACDQIGLDAESLLK